MGARLRVLLSAAENRTLFELCTATTVPWLTDKSLVRLIFKGAYLEFQLL